MTSPMPERTTLKTILVCGSREWRDRSAIRLALMCEPDRQGWGDYDDGVRIRVIHGGCRGADMLADAIARELHDGVQVFPADWNRYGPAAGPIRNMAMIAEKPDLVLAFGRGRGTDGCCLEATRRGIPVVRF